MSAAPKRPPRPSRPRSCIREDSDVGSSASAVEGTCSSTCNDCENDLCTSTEDTSTQSRLSATVDACSVEATTPAVEEVAAALSLCVDGVGDGISTGTRSDENVAKPEGHECSRTETGVSSPAKTVVSVKPVVAPRTAAAASDAKFRCSPKARKAPPVPPPPNSKEMRRLSSDGEGTLELLPDDGESAGELCRNVSRDLSPCSKCTPSPSSAGSVGNPDSKPALKPKPVTAVARESIGKERVSCAGLAVNASRATSERCSSNSQPSSAASTAATSSSPVYAVVNKSRTLRSTSNIDGDGSNVTRPSVARSKSTVATGSTPPRKPPRTFAHSEYMRLKSVSLPRPSEPQTGGSYDEVSAPSASTTEDPVNSIASQDDVDSSVTAAVHESGEAVSRDSSSDGSSMDAAVRTADAAGKLKRRQTDKLPAPPRPPPPSIADCRPCSASPRSSVADAAATCVSEHAHGRDAERTSSLPEEKSAANDRRVSGANVAAGDSDGIYAVPGEVDNCNVGRQSRLSAGASAATSDAAEPTLCLV